MITKTDYLELATSQQEIISKGNKSLINREIYNKAFKLLTSDNRILVITGMRRVGKSTLLQQLMNNLPDYCYLNAEDERLIHFQAEDFNRLNEAMIEVYGESNYYFFDEIQNIGNFEIIVRRLQDAGKKIILTGSNSSLLSIELGTRLTGRYIQIELFPFSFKEYLDFKRKKISKEDFYLPEKKVQLKQLFKQWMEFGGMPEYLKYEDISYLRTLFDNIIYRDIIARYNIRKHTTLKELVHLLANNLTLPVTYNSLKNKVGLSNAETVKEYISYLSNSYLFFELRKYSASYSKQLLNPKKIYLIDNAFHSMITLVSSENAGRKLENIIHLYYRVNNFELYYFNEGQECDFVHFDKERKPQLTQVCWELTSSNKDREIKGLIAAMQFFKSKEGIIITFDQEDEFEIEGKKIYVLPVWKFLLRN
ncbi:MAG TPA: ATP-binding protein [Tangfeifania sp.]|nr:ATP-binding protein [Tangfeifania sp.]